MELNKGSKPLPPINIFITQWKQEEFEAMKGLLTNHHKL